MLCLFLALQVIIKIKKVNPPAFFVQLDKPALTQTLYHLIVLAL